jgi:hypothetical protein
VPTALSSERATALVTFMRSARLIQAAVRAS